MSTSSRPNTPDVSHGRGGAGNIKPDDTPYVDGEVVRVGVEGSHDDGAFSAGRGGAGNIGDPGRESFHRKDRELVTPAAMQPAPPEDVDYHTGRGGAGNEHLAHGKEHHHGKEHAIRVPDGERSPQGLADKLKHKLFGMGKK
ncbi:hypothetical protein DL546_008014 [Coniochaeta pulveracea]|uniref:Uncharacterized protein n=1 Tax=Coniochaeta pulveracea TaxID=177199 RepID=A0A420YE16_9PEZI|nr:hypothetical protein DL546_008014 [Coniochaeta pulveracea]